MHSHGTSFIYGQVRFRSANNCSIFRGFPAPVVTLLSNWQAHALLSKELPVLGKPSFPAISRPPQGLPLPTRPRANLLSLL